MAASSDRDEQAGGTATTGAAAAVPEAPVAQAFRVGGAAESELQRKAKSHLWMHFTRMGSYAHVPVPVIVRGEGCYVYDEFGKRYLDAHDHRHLRERVGAHPREVHPQVALGLRLKVTGHRTYPAPLAH